MEPEVKKQPEANPNEQQKSATCSLSPSMCPKHRNSYRFYCKKQGCGQFICDNRRCLLNHLHEGQLFLCQFSPEIFQQLVDQIINFRGKEVQLSQKIEELNERFTKIKEKNARIFQELKYFDCTAQYILDINSPFTDRYLQQMENLVEINQKIQMDIEELQEEFNWNKIWTFLQPDHLVNRLKHQFPEISCLAFDQYPISYNNFAKRRSVIENIEYSYEGLMVIVFSEEGFVVGQFTANTSVETSSMFLNNFLFIVDPLGTLRKYKHHDQEGLIITAPIFLSESNHSALGIQLNADSTLSKLIMRQTNLTNQLLVKRVSSFICTRMI